MTIEEEINNLEQKFRDSSKIVLDELFDENLEDVQKITNHIPREKAIELLACLVFCATQYLNEDPNSKITIADVHMTLITSAMKLGMGLVSVSEWATAIQSVKEIMS